MIAFHIKKQAAHWLGLPSWWIFFECLSILPRGSILGTLEFLNCIVLQCCRIAGLSKRLSNQEQAPYKYQQLSKEVGDCCARDRDSSSILTSTCILQSLNNQIDSLQGTAAMVMRPRILHDNHLWTNVLATHLWIMSQKCMDVYQILHFYFDVWLTIVQYMSSLDF